MIRSSRRSNSSAFSSDQQARNWARTGRRAVSLFPAPRSWRLAGERLEDRRQRRPRSRHHLAARQHPVRSIRSRAELPGLNELTPRANAIHDFEDIWLSALSRTLGLTWQRGELDAAEQQASDRLVREKFATDDWNRRR